METKTKRGGADRTLNRLVGKRDELIVELWKTYAAIHDMDREQEWKEEDMDMWFHVTAHSVIQSRLSNVTGDLQEKEADQ